MLDVVNEPNKIQLFERRNYGQTVIYALGDEGKAIAAITGRKTVSASDIVNLRKLGVEFVLVADPEGVSNLIGGAA